MKKIYFLLVFIVRLGYAQAPAIEWQKCLGGSGDDYIYDVQQTSDGGYISAGQTSIGGWSLDVNNFLIVKLNADGSAAWQKSFGGSTDEYANSIRQTSDGGYIVAGSTNSVNGDVTGNHGGYDYWVIKLSVMGTIEWQKTFGGTGNDYAESIQQTTDGGYAVVGYTGSNNGDVTGNHGSDDYWVVKISSTGSLEWQKTYGGTGQDDAYSIQQTSDGGYVVAGQACSISGDVTTYHGGCDYWVVKLSATGNLEWQKTLGGSNADYCNEARQTLDGGYIVAGYIFSTNGDITNNHGQVDGWLVKISSTGTIEWQKTLGGTNYDYLDSVQQTSDGDYIVAGDSNSNDGDVSGGHGWYDAWVVKISSSGALVWQKTLGGSGVDSFGSIQQTTDGGYIGGGQAGSNTGDVSGYHGGQADGWMVKLGSPLSVSTFVNRKIKLFPNPATTILTVESDANLVFDKIIVTDLTGKKVLVQEQSSNQITVGQLSSGMYLLQAFSGEKQFLSKFVKE